MKTGLKVALRFSLLRGAGRTGNALRSTKLHDCTEIEIEISFCLNVSETRHFFLISNKSQREESRAMVKTMWQSISRSV
jgi:hypothetical protein